MNEREKAARDHIAAYVDARLNRYQLTPLAEAVLAANADRLAALRIRRECGTCAGPLPRGRIRFCSLRCWDNRR